MVKHTITFNNTDIDVTGIYYEGATASFLDAPDADTFEVMFVEVGGVEVTDLIDGFIDAIELEVINCKYR
jgi:hypothetical protein